jgi:hypothetical protein
VVVEVTCDCCGKSCTNEEYGPEYMQMEAHWGYMSGKDLEHWEAQICEACVDSKFPFVTFQKSGYMNNRF